MAESMTGVYSNTQIIEAIGDGHIVQRPYTPELINASSIDVRLGHYFYKTDRRDGHNVYNPHSEKDITRYFGGDYLEAKPLNELKEVRRALAGLAMDHALEEYYGDQLESQRAKLGDKALEAAVNKIFYEKLEQAVDEVFSGIRPTQPVIFMRPHERILAHTHEFIGIRAPGTSSMQAKSTTGRNGIVVCKDAGWGDPGYINRWTMEVQNDNDEYVPLQVGMPIAQIVFYHTGEVQDDYTKLSGNYQGSTDIDELIRNWHPSQMLPRSHKMKVEMPPVIEGLSGGLK